MNLKNLKKKLMIIQKLYNKFKNLIISIKIFLKLSLDKIIKPKKINIGGGSNFNEFGWTNYDINSLTNPMQLNPETVFYYKNNFVDLVYSSHCFEHLNDETIENLLNETLRVLKKNGKLLLIIPDYDFFLNKWAKYDESFFSQTKELGFNKHLHLWKNKNIKDNLDNRAAFLFCSYWNTDFEKKYRAFQSKKNINIDDETAFWGPPDFDFDKIKNLLKTDSPKVVVDYLRQEVMNKNDDYIFCHQNAWSKKEFIKFICENNFQILSSDKNEIINKLEYKKICGLKDHFQLSNYFLFEKC